MTFILFISGCPKGFYGKYCNKRCNCANNGRCHRTYGACLCDPGLYGRFCHLRKSHNLASVCLFFMFLYSLLFFCCICLVTNVILDFLVWQFHLNFCPLYDFDSVSVIAFVSVLLTCLCLCVCVCACFVSSVS